MKIWFNTPDIQTVKAGVTLGALYGVILRPKDLRENSRSLEALLKELVREEEGPIAVPISLDDPEEMIRQGQDLHHFSNRLIAAIPACKNGYESMFRLSRQSIPSLATCVLSAVQGLLAVQAGANYIELWVTEMVDLGLDPWQEMATLQKILAHGKPDAELIGGSLKTTGELLACFERGLDGVCITGPLFLSLLEESAKMGEYHEPFKTINFPV